MREDDTIYIASSGIAFAISIAIAIAFLIIQCRRKKDDKPQDLELQQLNLSIKTVSDKKDSFEGSQDIPDKTIVERYTIEQLKKATENFSVANLIEDLVFHGRFNGKNVAIKRTTMETISKIDFSLFHDTIYLHPNIIRLYGTCEVEGSDSYLVFDYAKNGSLKDWLHGGLAMKSHFIASCDCFLTWNQRLKICLDIAKALQFMHQIMSPCYVHRNIKSRNIFLDEEFNAKFGNFAMAQCAKDDQDGSKGYIAPEYIDENSVISPCIDIFAYGVVLLEVLSGKTAITWGNQKGEANVWLCERIKVILLLEDGNALREWMDNALGDNYSFESAAKLANLARACVEDDPSLRPNAGEIVEKLSRLVEVLEQGEKSIMSESSSKALVKAVVNYVL